MGATSKPGREAHPGSVDEIVGSGTLDVEQIREGTVIGGKYVVDRVLGRGGMGAVFAVRHQRLGDVFAMKVLHAEVAKRPGAVERFLREARAALRLDNEHVVRVMDVDVLESGSPYIVMEMLEGIDLQEHLAREGTLSVEETVTVVLQACDALVEAHAQGIVHRDLKPANLFLCQRHHGGRILKVLDFGISKLETAESLATATGAMLGTPLYMSPEQMHSAKDADARSDLWSLGVILYEALTGRVPFVGQSIPEICVAVMQSAPPSVRTLRPDVSPALSAIVDRCLAKEPRQRFASVSELAAALVVHAPPEARHHAERALRFLSSMDDQEQLERAATAQGERGSTPHHPIRPRRDARGSQDETTSLSELGGGDHDPAPSGPGSSRAMSTVSLASMVAAPDRGPRPRRFVVASALLLVMVALAAIAWQRQGAGERPAQAAASLSEPTPTLEVGDAPATAAPEPATPEVVPEDAEATPEAGGGGGAQPSPTVPDDPPPLVPVARPKPTPKSAARVPKGTPRAVPPPKPGAAEPPPKTASPARTTPADTIGF